MDSSPFRQSFVSKQSSELAPGFTSTPAQAAAGFPFQVARPRRHATNSNVIGSLNSPFARPVVSNAPPEGHRIHDVNNTPFAPSNAASTRADYDRVERNTGGHNTEYAHGQSAWTDPRTDVKREHWFHGNAGGGPALLAPTARSPFNLPFDEFKPSVIAQNQASRASSEVSMVLTQEDKRKIDEDSTDMLIKVATDLKGTRLALDEKRNALENLRAEFATVSAERDGLRKDRAELRHKLSGFAQRIKDNDKQLEEVKENMQSLREQSEESFDVVRKARLELPIVDELKSVVDESMKRFEGLIGEDGTFLPTQEWKDILSDLQADNTNKQQVIDLLRDRLESVQAEVADTKDRSSDLEHHLAEANRALKDVVEKSSNQLTTFVNDLKTEQNASRDILLRAASFEEKLLNSEMEARSLRDTLKGKDMQLADFKPTLAELTEVRCLLGDRERRLIGLEEQITKSRDRINEDAKTIKSLEEDISSTKAVLTDKGIALNEACKQLSKFETRIADMQALILQLEASLRSGEDQVRQQSDLCLGLEKGKEDMLLASEDLKQRNASLRSELDEAKKKLAQAIHQHESLQDRLEEQAMLLGLEKTAHGDIQEKLSLREKNHSEALDEVRLKHEGEMEGLRDELGLRIGEVNSLRAECAEMATNYEARVKELTSKNLDKNLITESLEQDIKLKRASNQELERQLYQLQENCTALQGQLDATRGPSESYEAEVNSLKIRIDELNDLANIQIQRGATILKRYELGDLTTEEKNLIVIVQKAGQNAHEQQLIAKENEIRQRDNVVKTLEKRKAELEDQLAKQLHKQQTMGKEGKGLAVSTNDINSRQKKTPGHEEASPKSSKVAKAPSKKATYSSSSNKAAKNQSANSGKNVSFAHLDRTASGDEDNQLDDSEDGQYVPANSSKKRGHEDMETEPGARRNVPLRRSRTTNIDSPSPSPSKEDVVEPKMKSRKRR